MFLVSRFPPDPGAATSPSVNALSGRWHEAQLNLLSPERRGSKKSILPRATRAGVVALSAGAGTNAGKRASRLVLPRCLAMVGHNCGDAPGNVPGPHTVRGMKRLRFRGVVRGEGEMWNRKPEIGFNEFLKLGLMISEIGFKDFGRWVPYF